MIDLNNLPLFPKGGKKEVKYTLMLSKEDKQILEEIAKKNNCKVSNVIHKAIEIYFYLLDAKGDGKNE